MTTQLNLTQLVGGDNAKTFFASCMNQEDVNVFKYNFISAGAVTEVVIEKCLGDDEYSYWSIIFENGADYCYIEECDFDYYRKGDDTKVILEETKSVYEQVMEAICNIEDNK